MDAFIFSDSFLSFSLVLSVSLLAGFVGAISEKTVHLASVRVVLF